MYDIYVCSYNTKLGLREISFCESVARASGIQEVQKQHK